MKIKTYADATRFLKDTQIALESNEAANGLMLGVCLRLARYPERITTPPCLKTVEDEKDLVLAAMMTPPHKLVVYGHQGDLAGAAELLVKELAGEGWTVPGVLGPSDAATQVAQKWTAITGQECDLEQRQRLYKLQNVSSPVPERGTLRLATEADLELVAEWRYGFHSDIFGKADRKEERHAAERAIQDGNVYLYQDRVPVSMAMTTRPTKSGISIGLVYTPPKWRGRGYATACVTELSRLLFDTGWQFCALFANLSNAPANRVYQKIGYEQVCDYDQYAFHA
jgi:predicted GNAT family acetyltransferase